MHDAALVKAVESPSLLETQRVVLDLRLRRRQEELLEAQKIAQRRSGTRGKEARTVELQAEANVAEVENALVRLLLSSSVS
jgi:ATP-binding cassette subfamily F protein 3